MKKKPGFSRRNIRQDLLFGLLFVGLWGMLFQHWRMIDASRNPRSENDRIAAEQVEKQKDGHVLNLSVAAHPGSLFACGRTAHVLMAGSRQIPSCFIDLGEELMSPAEIGTYSIELSEILNLDPGELYARLISRRGDRFVWVARKITRAQAQAVRELKHRAIGLKYEWHREYPNRELAATTICFTNNENQPGGGLHSMLYELMSAENGVRRVRADARRRAIWPVDMASVRARHGRDIYTSIDIVAQEALQRAVAEAVEKHGAKWGTGVVMDPNTGDILAMCSVPTFDPNHFSTEPAEHMLNRAVCMPFEPGSVFKSLIAAAAVQQGIVSYQTKINTGNGVYHAHRGGRISDHGSRYGLISVAMGLIKSSNVLMAKLGELVGNRRLHQMVRMWGMGEKTGVGLPGESGGIVRPADVWDGYSLRRVPFGQEISVTALQLATAYSAIANGGVLLKPRLVQYIGDEQGRLVEEIPVVARRRILSEDVARQTRYVLQDAVEHGTGKKCRLSQWSCWGKTGTAQIPGIGGYIDGAYVGSFIAGAPTEKPKIICLISIYWPDRYSKHAGGTVAAPYVKAVFEKLLPYLNVAPDRPQGLAGVAAR